MSTGPEPEHYGRIDEDAFKGICGAFLGIAIIAAIARTAIQIQQYRRLRADDYTLLFGCVTFIAASILLFVALDKVYLITGVTLGKLDPTTTKFLTDPDFPELIARNQKIVFAYLTLSITAIFSVKLTFIIFFRPMVDKMPNMILYWKGLLVLTVVSFVFTASSSFIECPHFGLSAFSCFVGHGYARTVGVSGAVCGLDLLTDLMIVFIPLTVLWRVKIRLQQKLILGIFLCLTIVIVIVSVTQISGEITGNHDIDLQWSILWQQIEASISIIVVSITGFRTLLGVRAQKKRQQSENRWERLQSYRERLIRKALRRNPADRPVHTNGLPSIPNATLTGMRSFINGDRSAKDLVGEHTESSVVDDHDGTSDENQWTLASSKTSGRHARNTSAQRYV